MFVTTKDLFKFRVQAKDGEIGGIYDLYFDDQQWAARYFVADTGHWLPGRLVLLSPEAVKHADREKRHLIVDLTKEMVLNAPAAGAERPVSQQHQIDLHDYYGWPAYWGAEMTYTQPIPFIPPEEALRDKSSKKDDPNLRSAREILGYHTEARDGEIGHVENFILEEPAWNLRYIVVDTKNWRPGPKVLLSPVWTSRIEWESRKLALDLDRRQLQDCPEYDPRQPLGREYEERLFDHYGRPKYWE